MFKKLVIGLFAAATLLALLATLHVYVVRKAAGGTLFWSSDEALLFVTVINSGKRFNSLSYVTNVGREMLGAAALPDDKNCSVIVLRVTRDKSEKYEDGNRCLTTFTLYRGSIYSGNDEGLWRWSDTRFLRLTQAERTQIDLTRAPMGPDFDDVDGWSERCCAMGRGRFPMTLEGQPIILTTSGNRRAVDNVSVDLQRADGPPQMIWSLQESPRTVSKSAYRQIFPVPGLHL